MPRDLGVRLAKHTGTDHPSADTADICMPSIWTSWVAVRVAAAGASTVLLAVGLCWHLIRALRWDGRTQSGQLQMRHYQWRLAVRRDGHFSALFARADVARTDYPVANLTRPNLTRPDVARTDIACPDYPVANHCCTNHCCTVGADRAADHRAADHHAAD